jgi:hypothetical protein
MVDESYRSVSHCRCRRLRQGTVRVSALVEDINTDGAGAQALTSEAISGSRVAGGLDTVYPIIATLLTYIVSRDVTLFVWIDCSGRRRTRVGAAPATLRGPQN